MCHITQMPLGIPGESTPSTQPELTFPYHLSTFHLGREKNFSVAFMEQESGWRCTHTGGTKWILLALSTIMTLSSSVEISFTS